MAWRIRSRCRLRANGLCRFVSGPTFAAAELSGLERLARPCKAVMHKPNSRKTDRSLMVWRLIVPSKQRDETTTVGRNR
jgi:hypothetical protein